MPQVKAIGSHAVALVKDDVVFEDVSIFFIIAHGIKVEGKFISNFSIYFPWGVDNFGWYDTDNGFPLQEIYRNLRQGRPQGLTPNLSLKSELAPTQSPLDILLSGILPTKTSVRASWEEPLLTRTICEVPNINLTPKDLTPIFCEKMLLKYYLDGGTEDVGIVCLKKDEKLDDVLRLLGVALKMDKYSDVLAICLCCSVASGDEGNAHNRADGYVQVLD